MKPISKMSLAECYEQLHFLAESYYTERDAIREIADRIFYLTRWIPVDESLPDNGETVLCRRVEGGMFGSREIKPQVGTFRNGSFDCVSDWTRVTHWRRIDTPEET